jgi:SAM-dependent methyltransferase
VRGSVVEHYEKLLAPVYTWMVGGVESAMARGDAELGAIGVPAIGSGSAVDLGAGFGMHAVPLARRGYAVTAIDTCEPLLQQLRSSAGALPIATINADLLDFREHVPQPAAVVLCMGDTLTHLPDAASADALLGAAAAALAPGGLFAATFRDYSIPLQADARFLLVRGDEGRILTCFLEYSDSTVRVHDVLHERGSDGWTMRVSSYPKLRLAPDRVMTTLATHGLSVRREAGMGGMVRILASRPPA